LAINFPSSPAVGEIYIDPASGNTYVCTAAGTPGADPAQWVGSGRTTDINSTFLKLDASNGPVTGPLSFEQGIVVQNGSDTTNTASLTIDSDWLTAEPSGTVRGLKIPDSTGVIKFFVEPDGGYLNLAQHGGGGFLSQLVLAPTSPELNFFATDVGSGATGTIPNNTVISAFKARWNPGLSPNLQPGTGSQVAGFRCDIESSAEYDSWNIYSSGTAPCFFNNKIIVASSDTNVVSSSGTGCEFTTSDGIYVGRTASNASDAAATFVLHTAAAGNAYDTDYRLVTFRDEGGNRAAIRFNNGGAVVLSNISDYRAKENIVDLTSASDIIKGLRPRKFNFKGSTNPVIGFVAHEVQEFIPTAVSGTKDAVDENGEPELQDFASTELIPYLTKALQEALTEIDNLKARLDAAGV